MGGNGGDRPGRLIPWRREQDAAGLMPIGVAIGGMLTLALAVAAGVIAFLFAVGQFQGFKKEPLTAGSLYDLLKIGFAFAAGIGGVVALVTAYRRQRVAEFAHRLAARAEEREATRLFNERFATAAGQLGDERPAVRLAGVYAMAGLADQAQRHRVYLMTSVLLTPVSVGPGGAVAAGCACSGAGASQRGQAANRSRSLAMSSGLRP
jgi:hypothetical protein